MRVHDTQWADHGSYSFLSFILSGILKPQVCEGGFGSLIYLFFKVSFIYNILFVLLC